jgi:hypothetical protein
MSADQPASPSASPSSAADGGAPIDMVLFCPKCGAQHVDEADPPITVLEATLRAHPLAIPAPPRWTNPPHRSHLCHVCETVWRPADVPTNGVVSVKTQGSADNWTNVAVAEAARPAVAPAQDAEHKEGNDGGISGGAGVGRVLPCLRPGDGNPGVAQDAALSRERTPQDYAVEHAEYMAVYGERVNAAVNDLAKAVQEFEDGQANESDVDAAQETLSEAQRALRDAIYEFRKRRDRATPSQASAAPEAAREQATAKTVRWPNGALDLMWADHDHDPDYDAIRGGAPTITELVPRASLAASPAPKAVVPVARDEWKLYTNWQNSVVNDTFTHFDVWMARANLATPDAAIAGPSEQQESVHAAHPGTGGDAKGEQS